MTVRVKDQVGELRFAHIGRTVRQPWHVFAGGNPNEAGGAIHKHASELFGGAGETKDIKRIEMPKYLKDSLY